MSKKKEKEKDPALSFVDAKGRVWTPKVTCRAVEIFEQRTGKGLFVSVFRLLASTSESVAKKSKRKRKKKVPIEEAVPATEVFKIGQDLFGSVGALMLLLYESCKDAHGEMPVARYLPGREPGERDPAEGDAVVSRKQPHARLSLSPLPLRYKHLNQPSVVRTHRRQEPFGGKSNEHNQTTLAVERLRDLDGPG